MARKSIINAKGVELHPVKPDLAVKLDSSEWREFTLDATEPIPADYIRWIARVRIVMQPRTQPLTMHPARPAAGMPNMVKNGQALPPPLKLSTAPFEAGDDMRLYPVAGSTLPPTAVLPLLLLGPATRDFTKEFPFSLDARNFTRQRRENQGPPVDDRTATKTRWPTAISIWRSPPMSRRSSSLDLAPENIATFPAALSTSRAMSSPPIFRHWRRAST